MKHLWMIIGFLLLCVPTFAEDFIVTEAEYVIISGNVSDTLGRTRLTPDSIRIAVSDSAGTELFDAWFEAADAQAALNGDVITFFDQWEDINGAASIGVFHIMATIASDAQNNVDLFSNYNYTLRGVTIGLNATFDEVLLASDTAQSILAEVLNIDAWNPITDNDSLIGDQSSLSARPAIGDTIQRNASTLTSAVMWDSLSDSAGAALIVLRDRIDALHDTLIYIGEHGLGIFVDSTAGNTNTVIGTDGTEKNPVSTLAAARTLALALGAHRFYIHGGSTFNGAGTDLGADYSEWEFYGEGFGIELAFGGQLVTNSYFHGITLSGVMHASGGDVLFERCVLGLISANYNGHAENCWLTDTLVAKSARDITFSHCQSGVTGDNTPTIDLSAGSSTLAMRHYSGGILIMNGTSTDTISIETDGQVIIDASNTSLNITLRGMLTITDNGTTTLLTKDAVFSRQEGETLIIDTVNAIMDSIQLGLNMKAISGDATAADNLETMLDGTGGKVLDLAGLHVRATSAEDTAIIAIGADNGPGVHVAAAGDGNGLQVANGGGSGAAILAAASGTGHSFGLSNTGSGNAFSLVATSGDAFSLTSSSGADMSGAFVAVNFATDAIDANALATDAVDEIWEYDTANISGAQAVGSMLKDTSAYQGAAAGITIDGIWEYDTANISGAQAVGSMLKDTSAYQGAASGLTKEAVADAVWDTAEAGGRQINYRSLTVDSGTVFAATATGVGLAISGGPTSGHGMSVTATDGHGASYAGGTGGDGAHYEGGATGEGLHVLGGVTSGDAVLLEAQTDGDGIQAIGTGSGKDVNAAFVDSIDNILAKTAYFDTLIYQGGVWVDAGANTNTVVGVDGTPKNPVGTIAAAKTIADALGFATIFFLDGANETIAATMEHYRFTGITRNATVNLGSQDVDGSFFEHLMLTGQQGGTGSISVINSGLSTLDSLQIHARNCAILGPISLRGGDKTNHFDKCYSSVAGSGSPILNFNDASDSIYVNWRAYSGGLELQNMTTNHVMSYEADGQLIINANCDNGVISARGMMTITDNGTTMSITKDAVFSRSEADFWVWANADTTQVDSSDVGVWMVNNLSGAAGGLDTLSDAYRDAMLGLMGDTLLARGFGIGSQTYTFTHLALDTSGSDAPVEDVKAFITNIATSVSSGPQYSNASGTFTWGVDSGSYDLFLKKPGYVFARDTFLITTDSTDTTRGYDWAPTATPGGANTCIVFGNIHTIQAAVAKYSDITITFPHEQYNTCDSSITHPWSVPLRALKDGTFQVELTKSSCLAAKMYKIEVEYKGKKMAAHEFTVPDQDTFELFF